MKQTVLLMRCPDCKVGKLVIVRHEVTNRIVQCSFCKVVKSIAIIESLVGTIETIGGP